MIICCVAAGGFAAGGYLLYQLLSPAPQETDVSEELPASVPKESVRLVRQEDHYALFNANKQRIMDWCTDHEYMFRNGGPQSPPRDEMTEAEQKKLDRCVGGYIMENSPPEPHRTIEDIFDVVDTIYSAKHMCYREAWNAKNSKSGK